MGGVTVWIYHVVSVIVQSNAGLLRFLLKRPSAPQGCIICWPLPGTTCMSLPAQLTQRLLLQKQDDFYLKPCLWEFMPREILSPKGDCYMAGQWNLAMFNNLEDNEMMRKSRQLTLSSFMFWLEIVFIIWECKKRKLVCVFVPVCAIVCCVCSCLCSRWSLQ